MNRRPPRREDSESAYDLRRREAQIAKDHQAEVDRIQATYRRLMDQAMKDRQVYTKDKAPLTIPPQNDKDRWAIIKGAITIIFAFVLLFVFMVVLYLAMQHWAVMQ